MCRRFRPKDVPSIQPRPRLSVGGPADRAVDRARRFHVAARRDQVACSAETLSELGDDVDYVDLGTIPVKGRAEPVACYQINRIGALANPNAAPAMKINISAAVAAGSH